MMDIITKQTAGVVTFNYDEIKAELKKQMDIYSSLVFTEEQKADAKKDLANLRKLAKAIDAKKREVRSEYIKPYLDFESKIKELLQLVNEPIDLINKQVAEFDKKQKEEKKAKIIEVFNELAENYPFITLESIYKKEWENVSTSMKSIKQDISARISEITIDINTLENFKSDAFERARDMYLSNGYNLAAAIQYIQKYEEEKKEILKMEEERRRKAEEAKVQESKEDNEQLKGKMNITDFTEISPFGGFVIPDTEEVEPKSITTFQITATHEQLADLREFLITNNIEYKEI